VAGLTWIPRLSFLSMVRTTVSFKERAKMLIFFGTVVSIFGDVTAVSTAREDKDGYVRVYMRKSICEQIFLRCFGNFFYVWLG